MNNEDKGLLSGFGFSRALKREVYAAWLEAPDGVRRCALRARAAGERDGTTGAGLLVTMLRAGEHRLTANPSAQRVTGWRFVRGSHGGTYVEDPKGTDRLPPAYDLVTRSTIPRAEPEPERLTPELPKEAA